MPTIEISQEQADWLASGRSISIVPRTLKTYVCVNTHSGHVFEFIVDGDKDKAVAYRAPIIGAGPMTSLSSALWSPIPEQHISYSQSFTRYKWDSNRIVLAVPNREDTKSPSAVLTALGI